MEERTREGILRSSTSTLNIWMVWAYLGQCLAIPCSESLDREARTVVQTENGGPQNLKNPTYQTLEPDW